jgi:hypothetical protein
MKGTLAQGHRRRAMAGVLAVAALSGMVLAGCRTGGGMPWRTTTTVWTPPWTPPPTPPTTRSTTPTPDCHGHTNDDHANMTTTTAGHDHGGTPATTRPPCNGQPTTTVKPPAGVNCGTGRYVAPGSSPGGGHSHEPPARLNHEPTAQQQTWARQLIARTASYVKANIPTRAAAEARGYRTIGDMRHWTNAQYRMDGCEFDERKIESLVIENNRVVAAMYNMEPATNVENVPDWAGNWMVWHNHNNLCWKAPVGQPGWTELAGAAINGRCTSGYLQDPPVLMVHVWIRNHPCGAFAGDGAVRASNESSCLPNVQGPGI